MDSEDGENHQPKRKRTDEPPRKSGRERKPVSNTRIFFYFIN